MQRRASIRALFSLWSSRRNRRQYRRNLLLLLRVLSGRRNLLLQRLHLLLLGFRCDKWQIDLLLCLVLFLLIHLFHVQFLNELSKHIGMRLNIFFVQSRSVHLHRCLKNGLFFLLRAPFQLLLDGYLHLCVPSAAFASVDHLHHRNQVFLIYQLLLRLHFGLCSDRVLLVYCLFLYN